MPDFLGNKAASFDSISPESAKGDLIAHDGTSNTRVGVGSDGDVLTADSTQATGVKWAPPTGSGGLAIGGAVTGGTAGRVLYEGAGPVLADSPNLTFDGTTLLVTALAGGSTSGGDFTISSTTAATKGKLYLNGTNCYVAPNGSLYAGDTSSGLILDSPAGAIVTFSGGGTITWGNNAYVSIFGGVRSIGLGGMKIIFDNNSGVIWIGGGFSNFPAAGVRGVGGQTAPLFAYQLPSSTATDRDLGYMDAVFLKEAGGTVHNTDASYLGVARRLAQDFGNNSGGNPNGRETDRGWSDGTSGRWAAVAPNSAPTDAHIQTGQVSIYLDETNNLLKFRVRYSDGTTLKTGSITLS